MLRSRKCMGKALILTHSKFLSVSNGLDPDQDRSSVGPDLGPNCLQRFSADDKSCD